MGGQNLENLAPARPESVKLAIWLYYGDEECWITSWPKLTLSRPGAYMRSFFLCSARCTWFLRGPNTRGNKCLSVKESGKQNNKGGRDLKKILLLSYPQLRRAWRFLLFPAVPSAFGFNQVQGRNSTSCCLALIKRSQILQIGRFLLLVFLIWWIICFKVFGKGHYRGSGPSFLLFPSLFITTALKTFSRM